ncbi:1366_t:CDS:2 [Acaulospora colombiana]|uniref:1366_t:CDS:1 n=1 Tax=Acaulospora colombiana TaxID=27376 RepID=A0ACA9M8V6_9GLOM|nr:1366_t:CDS:2 [Acaulospora colombiana]
MSLRVMPLLPTVGILKPLSSKSMFQAYCAEKINKVELTLKRPTSYRRLGLMTSLNGISGGVEKLYPEEPTPALDVVESRKTLDPDEGIIERDEQGNVINVIIRKNHEEDTKVLPTPAKTEVVRALEIQAAEVYTHERRQSEGERRLCEELINKYGNDYQSMSRDIKINTYQHTAAQLKKKCEKYLKER